MALVGRTPRRGATGRRWLVIGIVLTLFVLLIDASLKSQSTNDARTLSGQAWLDQVVPAVQASNAEGRVITQFRTNGLTMSATTITTALDALSGQAEATYKQVAALRPPADISAAAGLLEACLLVRARAAGEYAKAAAAVLSSAAPQAGQPDPQANAVIAAAQDMEVSDQAYQLFTANLPKLGADPPPSKWIPDPSQYQPDTLETFLVSLRNATSLTPVHQLAIEAVSTNPAPVSISGPGGVQVLPPEQGITVTVVVADVGNQAENNLTVTAQVSPAASGGRVREFVSLTAGGAQSVQLGDLYPEQGPDVTLTITVTPPSGSPTPVVTKSIIIQMPAPGSAPSTTTTTAPPPATTVPGQAPGSPSTT